MTPWNRTTAVAVKTLLFGVACLFLATAAPRPCLAKIQSKRCSNCHTMHNSQRGVAMAYEYSGGSFDPRDTPHLKLLVTNCVGCHTALDGSTWQDSTTGAPIVFNTSEPSYGADAGDGRHAGLAAGNFYWVEGAGGQHHKGHNIFTQDSTYSEAPGHIDSGYCADCHDTLTYTSTPYSPCGNCHMVSGVYALEADDYKWHHQDDTGPVIDTQAEGWYRFLAGHQNGEGMGVAGIESSDWEHSPTSTNHNEYLGYTSDDKTGDGGIGRTGANTMSGFCTGCHEKFHRQDTSSNGASPWLRHPSDTELPNSGDYVNYTVFNPLAPVARPSLSTVSSTVNPGQDLVFCLSCHRAHASPYSYMLRWDYKSDYGADVGEMISGCGVCHTLKY